MNILCHASGGRRSKSPIQRSVSIRILLLVILLLFFSSIPAYALQQHSLTPDQKKADSQTDSHEGQQGAASKPAPGPAHQEPAANPPAAPPPANHGAAAPPKAAPAPGAHGAPAPQVAIPGVTDQGAAGGDHGSGTGTGAAAHGGAHGPALPQISPISGVTFVQTMINLLDHELNGRTLGWRPNDILIGRFTDDINNYQLGVLEALRFTAIRLKDSLTRMGDADSYDPDLEQALNLLMNRATSFWFPSAEGSYNEALDHFRNFVGKLERGQRSFYSRKDNLQTLLNAYKDLLGNVNRSLVVGNVSWFKADDSVYYAKGVAHVYYEILRVTRVGFEKQLGATLYGLDIMDEIIHELSRVEQIDPWIILDGDLGSLTANHRANLNAPLSETAHLLGVLAQF